MFPTLAVCFLATTAMAACSVRTRVHYDRSRNANDPYRPQSSERFQSRASSIFGGSGQQTPVGFPYRFVFPANHPALNGGPIYSQYVQNPHQAEPLYSAEEQQLYTAPPSAKQLQHHHALSDHGKQQQQQQQQFAFDSVGKQQVQYDFLSGKHGQQLLQPPYHHHVIKQPKHYQSYELAQPHVQAPGPGAHHHQPYGALTAASVAQPIMLLIPSSGQPGAPYQTLVLVPSAAPPAPPAFPGFHPHVQQLHTPPQFLGAGGFVTHPRGPPPVNHVGTGFPSGFGGMGVGGPGLGKFPGAQLIHRSHEPLQQQQQQQLHHKQHKSAASSPAKPSYQGPVSAQASRHVQQPLEDKVGQGLGASGENADDGGDGEDESAEGGRSVAAGVESTKRRHEEKLPEFGDKTATVATTTQSTSTAKSPKRIVVA